MMSELKYLFTIWGFHSGDYETSYNERSTQRHISEDDILQIFIYLLIQQLKGKL
jgi:hypothetical protein